jgi:hypothetical protein
MIILGATEFFTVAIINRDLSMILLPALAVVHIAQNEQMFELTAFYEKPIQRPPKPTPDHNKTETRATTLFQTGLNCVSPAMITLR